jgi:hypothetical protein
VASLRFAGRAVDARARGRGFAESQAQQREPRLGTPSRFSSLPVRRFGPPGIAAQPVQFAELIERRAGSRLLAEHLARALGFAGRLAPIALKLQDFRAPNQALAAVRHQIRL